MHQIQANILKKLLKHKKLRFSELNTDGLTTDHFNYHIQQLVSNAYVLKQDTTYELTQKGKIHANRLTVENKDLVGSHLIVLLIVCVRENKNGEDEYLFCKRLKDPFYGFYDFVSGKVHVGQDLMPTAHKMLQEKTGITAKLRIVGMQHKSDFDNMDKLLEDKFMFILRGDECTGELIGQSSYSQNEWLTESDLLQKAPTFKNISLFIKMAKNKEFMFDESKYLNEVF